MLGVNPLTGEMKRDWVESMKQADLRPVVQTWPVGGVIWDQASSHRGKKIAALPIKQVFQPPYSSELNAAERVFEELRRAVEGRIYETVEHKKQAVEAVYCTNWLPTRSGLSDWSAGAGYVVHSTACLPRNMCHLFSELIQKAQDCLYALLVVASNFSFR